MGLDFFLPVNKTAFGELFVTWDWAQAIFRLFDNFFISEALLSGRTKKLWRFVGIWGLFGACIKKATERFILDCVCLGGAAAAVCVVYLDDDEIASRIYKIC